MRIRCSIRRLPAPASPAGILRVKSRGDLARLAGQQAEVVVVPEYRQDLGAPCPVSGDLNEERKAVAGIGGADAGHLLGAARST